MYLVNRIRNQISSWHNRKYLNFILSNYASDADTVMEIGSCTGRLLQNFKRRGALTFYNDLDIPEVKNARIHLDSIKGIPTEFLIGDFLKIQIPQTMDFTFSTGLFHTLPPQLQEAKLAKMCEVSNSVFILVPDLTDLRFLEPDTGFNPGRIGSTKYQLIDFSKILNYKYEYIQRGSIYGRHLGVNHDFNFYFGGSLKPNLESSRFFRFKYFLMNIFPIQPK